jgi:hypothetical protein
MAPLRAGAAAGLLALGATACGSGTGAASASRAWRAVGRAERPAAVGGAPAPAVAGAPAVGGAPAPLALAAEPDHGAAPRPSPAASLGPVVQVPIRSWPRLPPSPPVRLEIPAIGVSTALVRLGLGPGGAVQVPGDFRTAGWFTGGAQPGQLGPALVAGHVDSRSGPAVFYRLHELRPGDEVRVVRADRRVVRFVVVSLARYPKRALPGERLYGPATAPSLHLVTCAGAFDRRRHSYRDNLVVEAAIAGPRQGTGR